MAASFRLLMVEDNQDDAELIVRELKRHGYQPDHSIVADEEGVRSALKDGPWDMVICDYSLPGFGADRAFEMVQSVSPDTPFILASGIITEETAIDQMQRGVKDYIQKDKLERLAPVVARELKELASRRLRKEAEADRLKLSTAINQLAEAVIITDTTPRILYVNPAFEKVSGYTREEATGQNPGFNASGQHNNEFYNDLWEALNAGRTWHGRFINKRKNGDFFFEESTISPVKDETGNVTNYVAVKRDITDEILLEKSRNHFTVVTAHELSTPLTELVMVDNLLKEKSYANPEDSELNRIQNQLSNCLRDFERVVSGVNLLSQLGNPLEDSNLTHTHFFYLLSSAISKAETSQRQEERNVALHADLDAMPRTTTILANEEMISKAMEEILSNAIKYTPDGGNVYLSGKVEGAWVTVTVRDEGCGIPHEMQKYILTPFSSAGDALYFSSGKYKFHGGGMGIGLTIANLVTGYHRGRLFIESDGENKGTAVTIKFPRLAPDQEGDASG